MSCIVSYLSDDVLFPWPGMTITSWLPSKLFLDSTQVSPSLLKPHCQSLFDSVQTMNMSMSLLLNWAQRPGGPLTPFVFPSLSLFLSLWLHLQQNHLSPPKKILLNGMLLVQAEAWPAKSGQLCLPAPSLVRARQEPLPTQFKKCCIWFLTP